MDCLFPKKENKESKADWLAERRNIRMYNARLSAIIDELEDHYHYEDYKKRFKFVVRVLSAGRNVKIML